VRFLIDSNALLWWRAASSSLSRSAFAAIGDPSNEVLISIAALWEITIKISVGKLKLEKELEAIVDEEGLVILPVEFNHLRFLETLPRLHRDPFDRMMIAQALAEGMPIATADRIFAAYGVQIVW
jgi:PIN domain nuclease of toxin-antitoxin system